VAPISSVVVLGGGLIVGLEIESDEAVTNFCDWFLIDLI